jgi:hypothetical protein
MTQEEKLGKACMAFSSLSEDKKDYILGILQALCFAKDTEDMGQDIQDKSQVESCTVH